ncbi:MAG TPA: alpha/beta hydrolase [Acidimicrobiia bacterium]|nr:alpha/beta hydrolase [Acidimicrobiia bacterium]
MSWTEGDVRLDGATIHYHRRGSGPPVVLAHGVLDDGRCWTRIAEALEPDYDLVAYDARFHGQSDAPEDGQWRGVADFIGVVDALGLDRPSAIGHSLGAATIAGALAGRPDLLGAAVLADPPWREPLLQPGELGGVVGLFREMIGGKSVDEVAALGREMNPTWQASELEPWAESKVRFRGFDAMASVAGNLADDWKVTVAAFRVPVLLVTGGDESKGRIVTPEVAARARALSPSLEVVCFEGAGHNVQRDAYDDFVVAVRYFLARTRSG